jgi:hypothetical protein
MGQSWGHKVRIWNREVVETNACKEEKLTGEPIEEAIRKWSVVSGQWSQATSTFSTNMKIFSMKTKMKTT